MLTNALGIGEECKVSTFVVPLADGDRFLLCSDGISEYVPENEVGDVLTKQPSPARAAQRLIDLALERGGGDNATAVVVRVLEAGETPLPAEQRKKDDAAIGVCALWGTRVTPQQRLRAITTSARSCRRTRWAIAWRGSSSRARRCRTARSSGPGRWCTPNR
jgi:serine/threonine protein phosphatase PrpC